MTRKIVDRGDQYTSCGDMNLENKRLYTTIWYQKRRTVKVTLQHYPDRPCHGKKGII